MTLQNFRRAIKREIIEVIVAEGEGTDQSPIREVHYFLDENLKQIFKKDPCEDD